MASFWPRPSADRRSSLLSEGSGRIAGFEREGDKMYLAAEVLQGHYGKETDIFRYDITIETQVL
jgi:mitosis inhibitor protein kinase SWE1